jgi:hypothetical protein
LVVIRQLLELVQHCYSGRRQLDFHFPPYIYSKGTKVSNTSKGIAQCVGGTSSKHLVKVKVERADIQAKG